MTESAWDIEEFKIAEIFLDKKNIRLPFSKTDQNSLILDLFDNENAFEIAKSYSENGVYPHEFPIGIRENSKVIVIEGNRRIAALKALNEPALVPRYSNKLKKLENRKIAAVEMVMAPNREVAIKYIASQHTTTQRRPWKPLRQAYFYQSQLDSGKTIDQLIQEYPDNDIPGFVKKLELYKLAKSAPIEDSDLRAKVHDERNFPITTLARIYDDQSASKALGIGFTKQGIAEGKIPLEEFQKANKKLVEGIASGDITSRNTNSSTDIAKIIEDLPSESKPDLSKTGSFSTDRSSKTAANTNSHKGVSAIQPNSAKKTPVSGKPPKRGLFRKADIPFKVSSRPLEFMYDELRKIDVTNCPNATHDLLRSFLECSLCVYLKTIDEYKNVKARKKGQPTLAEMMAEMMAFLGAEDSEIVDDKNVKQVINQVKSDFGSQYSLERMNMINHNENWVSSEKDVRAAWSKLETLLKFLLDPTES